MRFTSAPTRLSIALLCIACVTLAGCRRDFATEADMLRERVVELERQVEQLELRNRELRGELRSAARARNDDVSEEIRLATPNVAGISIGRFSHGRDTTDDAVPDTLRLYITPADGRGRFVPLAGHLRVHVAVLPDDADAITLIRREFTPEQVRDAYRSGLVGTHYTFSIPIDWPDDIDASQLIADEKHLLVRAVYVDGHSHEQFADERPVRLRHDRTGRSSRERPRRR